MIVFRSGFDRTDKKVLLESFNSIPHRMVVQERRGSCVACTVISEPDFDFSMPEGLRLLLLSHECASGRRESIGLNN
jgi:hypothetical protein